MYIRYIKCPQCKLVVDADQDLPVGCEIGCEDCGTDFEILGVYKNGTAVTEILAREEEKLLE